jgi:hypothetical protein
MHIWFGSIFRPVNIIRLNTLSKSYSTKISTNIVDFDDKFKKSVYEFLKQQNIKKLDMTFEYCPDHSDYIGNITVKYFPEKRYYDNELDYYIQMSNEFAYKN